MSENNQSKKEYKVRTHTPVEGYTIEELWAKEKIAPQNFLLSDGKTNKEKVYELSTTGQELNKPSDVIKQPYVFEFLGIKEQ